MCFVNVFDLNLNKHKIIKKTLEKFKGNRRKTAQSLNISERTLYRKINDYGIKKKYSD